MYISKLCEMLMVWLSDDANGDAAKSLTAAAADDECDHLDDEDEPFTLHLLISISSSSSSFHISSRPLIDFSLASCRGSSSSAFIIFLILNSLLRFCVSLHLPRLAPKLNSSSSIVNTIKSKRNPDLISLLLLLSYHLSFLPSVLPYNNLRLTYRSSSRCRASGQDQMSC